MNKLNPKGFGAIEAILIVVILGIIGGAGYYVFISQNKADTSLNNAASSQGEPQVDKNKTVEKTITSEPSHLANVESTTQEVTYKGAKYSFSLPKGWIYKDIPVMDDENLSYVTDPTKTIQLELQIIKRPQTAGQASGSGTFDASNPFLGINNKKFYIAGFTGSSKETGKFELLSISADCQPWHCNTPISDDYSLNLAIRSTDGLTPISLDNPIVKDVKFIITTIKLG